MAKDLSHDALKARLEAMPSQWRIFAFLPFYEDHSTIPADEATAIEQLVTEAISQGREGQLEAELTRSEFLESAHLHG